MKLNITQLEYAHRQIDEFIRNKKQYEQAIKRSKSKVMDLVKARHCIKKAIDLLGDDEFFDAIAMLENGPLAHDERVDLCRVDNASMRRELLDSDVAEEWGIIACAFLDNIPILIAEEIPILIAEEIHK